MPEPAGVFVTGTGTEVGKTVVAAVLAHTLAREGRKVAVFKPAVTGLDEPPADGPISRATGDVSAHRPLPTTSCCGLRLDPSRATRRSRPIATGHPLRRTWPRRWRGRRSSRRDLLEAARAAADDADMLVCEGVGGLLVPLGAS